jgi:hypothetical protein
LAAVVVEVTESTPGLVDVVGGEHVAQQLLGQVGGAHLALRVADLEEGDDALPRGFRQTLVGGEESSAYAIERVIPAAAVAEAGDLGAPAHLVERLVGQADGVEVSTTNRAWPKPSASARA